ncbi:MAG: 30S ribosomal protein S20 [Planctomycetota bacterium]
MAHSKQALKRNRQNIKNRASNKATRSAMKTAVRKVMSTEAKDGGKAGMPDAMRKIDKAAKQGVLHKNAAARHKSRLARRLAKAK